MTAVPKYLLKTSVAALASTWRIEIVDREHLIEARRRGNGILYALWHHTMLPLIWVHRREGTTMLVSRHRDGGYLADTVVGLGYEVVRGSSRRGGVRALRTAARILEERRSFAITPDGPRGPARRVKQGIVRVAQLSGATIVPVTAHSETAVRFRSWDRFMLPLPFADVCVVYGEPFEVDSSPDRLPGAVQRLQDTLERITMVARK